MKILFIKSRGWFSPAHGGSHIKHALHIEGKDGGGTMPDSFGPIFKQFRHDASGAIAHLKKVKTGEAVAALYHPDVGDIDLVWGNKTYGVAKLVEKHPEVVGNLQQIIDGLVVKKRSSNRVILESKDHKAIVNLDWIGSEKTWLLTAYEKRADASATIDTASTKGKDDTARFPVSPVDTLPELLKKSSPMILIFVH